MKTKLGLFFVLAALVAGTAPGFAQTTTDAAAAKAVATADEMEQLVAPIALYPDVLVALILPAAIESADVVLAARFLERGGAEAQIDGQPWDDSVKGLARYPDVVKWMDENLSWTRQLGDAYLDKPEEVMAAIQRVRARAKAQGLLVSTAEQEVVAEGEYIRIVPAQPNVVYVPRYDPELIFVEHRVIYYRPDPWITFGVGFGVGWWLGYDCDWGRRVIVVNPSYRHHWRIITTGGITALCTTTAFITAGSRGRRRTGVIFINGIITIISIAPVVRLRGRRRITARRGMIGTGRGNVGIFGRT